MLEENLVSHGRLAGKVAVVTGAGSGLGQVTARRLAEEGCAVACADISARSADVTAASIVELGGRAIGVQADVSVSADCVALVERADQELGPIDVLFANAGIAGSGRAGDVDEESWNRVISVNLTGVWLSARAVLPGMVDRGKGSIILQASVGGIVGVPGIASYAAAKGGVIALTRQMAVDYGPQGIRVNATAPGTVMTPLVRATYDSGGGFAGIDKDTLEKRYPLRRLGEGIDVANAVVYLASDESSWVTGTVLKVDGGMTAG